MRTFAICFAYFMAITLFVIGQNDQSHIWSAAGLVLLANRGRS